MRTILAAILLALGLSHVARSDDSDIDRDLATIARVGPNGTGSAAAREAAQRVSRCDVEVLPKLLSAMDTPNVVAANWCRTAFDAIVARELAKPQPALPVARFKEYVRDGRRQGRARRLVLDVLDGLDPEFRPQLIPSLVDDPEFREQAVAALMSEGDAAKKRGDAEAALRLYRTAFRSARSSDQLVQTANRLQSAGETASVVEQMGFVVDWLLLGPFDAPEKTGFAKSFPPENEVDLKAEYPGKEGRTLRWARHHIDNQLGQADLIKAIAPVKEAVAYAYAELHSDVDREVQVRCGADDNLSVWINGEKAFAREQWLNGTRLDRFTAPAKLKAGTNRVLVKICQGPQHVDPEVPNNWSFQLRFCEADGLGVRMKCVLP